MRTRRPKYHQLVLDEISHKLTGEIKSRFKTFKHRGQQAGAFGGRLKTARA